MMAGPETQSIVKQLQAQLKELSQATNKRNDYIEEVKRRTVSDSAMVRARIANIEKNLKGGPVVVPVPSPASKGGVKPIKTSLSGTDSPVTSPTARSSDTPRGSSNQLEDDSIKPRSQSTSNARQPQFPAMKSSYLEPHTEREEHVLRPSLAKTIKVKEVDGGPTYHEVTEKAMKSQSKLTVSSLGSSVLNKKRASVV